MAAQSDWVIDIGPGAGDKGGRIVTAGTPQDVARSKQSRTAPYLAPCLIASEEKQAAILRGETA